MREIETARVAVGERETVEIERFVPVAARNGMPDLPENFYLTVKGPRGGVNFCMFLKRDELQQVRNSLDHLLNESKERMPSGKAILSDELLDLAHIFIDSDVAGGEYGRTWAGHDDREADPHVHYSILSIDDRGVVVDVDWGGYHSEEQAREAANALNERPAKVTDLMTALKKSVKAAKRKKAASQEPVAT